MSNEQSKAKKARKDWKIEAHQRGEEKREKKEGKGRRGKRFICTWEVWVEEGAWVAAGDHHSPSKCRI